MNHYKKNLCYQLLIAFNLLLGANQICAFYPQNMSSWEVMEDAFITKPQVVSKSLKSRAIKIGVAGAIASMPTYIVHHNTRPTGMRIRTFNNKALVGTTFLLPFTFTYALVDMLMIKNEECHQFKNILSKWSVYKNIVPKSLHSVFETFINGDKIVASNEESNIEEAIRLIKLSVYKQFPNKYKENVNPNKDFFDSKHFLATLNADIGRILNGIADLIRAFSGR